MRPPREPPALLIGSFLNVCIYRWPRDLSVVHPRSRCLHCEAPIAWFDNIPVASYFFLRGRCRQCRAAISPRYPAVELLTAALFAAFVWRFGASPEASRGCVFAAMLTVLAFADVETRILPDEFTIGGALAGLAFAAFLAVPDTTAHALAALFGLPLGPRLLSLAESVLGAIVPSGALWLGGTLFEKLRHKEGLGFGDVKMMAMIGAFLGVRGALLSLMAGSVLWLLSRARLYRDHPQRRLVLPTSARNVSCHRRHLQRSIRNARYCLVRRALLSRQDRACFLLPFAFP